MCGGRLPGGMNKNSYIWIGSCVVAMVTALITSARRRCFDQKIHSQEAKINESSGNGKHWRWRALQCNDKQPNCNSCDNMHIVQEYDIESQAYVVTLKPQCLWPVSFLFVVFLTKVGFLFEWWYKINALFMRAGCKRLHFFTWNFYMVMNKLWAFQVQYHPAILRSLHS